MTSSDYAIAANGPVFDKCHTRAPVRPQPASQERITILGEEGRVVSDDFFHCLGANRREPRIVWLLALKRATEADVAVGESAGAAGRGYGHRIWTVAMERLEGRMVGLDGVIAQQDNYRKSGFVPLHHVGQGSSWLRSAARQRKAD